MTFEVIVEFATIRQTTIVVHSEKERALSESMRPDQGTSRVAHAAGGDVEWKALVPSTPSLTIEATVAARSAPKFQQHQDRLLDDIGAVEWRVLLTQESIQFLPLGMILEPSEVARWKVFPRTSVVLR